MGPVALVLPMQDPTQLDRLLALGYNSFKMVQQSITRRGNRQFSGGLPEEAPGKWGDATSIRNHPYWSVTHMHVRIDKHGNRLREEHDLHARLDNVALLPYRTHAAWHHGAASSTASSQRRRHNREEARVH